MAFKLNDTPASWTAAELDADRRWVFTLDDQARCDLVAALTKALDRNKSHFDYSRDDFDLSSAYPVLAGISAADTVVVGNLAQLRSGLSVQPSMGLGMPAAPGGAAPR